MHSCNLNTFIWSVQIFLDWELAVNGQATSMNESMHYLNCLSFLRYCWSKAKQKLSRRWSTLWYVTNISHQKSYKWSKCRCLLHFCYIITERNVLMWNKFILFQSSRTLEKLLLPSISTHPQTHRGLDRDSMTAWTCEAESDKLISNFLWCWEMREQTKKRRERANERKKWAHWSQKKWGRVGGVRQIKKKINLRKEQREHITVCLVDVS